MSDIFINKPDSEISAGLTNAISVLQTGGAATNFINDRVLYVLSGKFTTSNINITELGYLSGASSSIQTQLNTLTNTKANSEAPVFIGPMSVGISTGSNYPHVQFIAAQAVTEHTYPGYLGVTGEAVADVTHTAAGVGGNAKTYGASEARGVVGVGKVSATGDTAESVGVEGRVTDPHAGGNNVAFRAYATTGALNYSFKGYSGLMLNAESITSGDGTDYITIDKEYGIRLGGTATNYKDLYPTQFIPSPVSGATVTAYNGNLAGYELTKNATKAVQAMFQLNHDYKEGSSVYPHLHVFAPSATGTKLKLTIEYTWVNIDATGAVTPTETPVLITGITASTVKNNLVIPLGTISGDLKTISSILTIRVRRDTNDADSDIDSSVWLKSIDLHYEIDTIGSRTVSGK